MSCYGGSHTWSWSAASTAKRPFPSDRCCCGTYTLADLERWAKEAELRADADKGQTTSGGDPVVVHPADSRAESQSELNGPSGSPTSPLERADADKEQT